MSKLKNHNIQITKRKWLSEKDLEEIDNSELSDNCSQSYDIDVSSEHTW